MSDSNLRNPNDTKENKFYEEQDKQLQRLRRQGATGNGEDYQNRNNWPN